jgi:hypothetical protein
LKLREERKQLNKEGLGGEGREKRQFKILFYTRKSTFKLEKNKKKEPSQKKNRHKSFLTHSTEVAAALGKLGTIGVTTTSRLLVHSFKRSSKLETVLAFASQTASTGCAISRTFEGRHFKWLRKKKIITITRT